MAISPLSPLGGDDPITTIPTIIFEAEEILDMRIVESDREYKIQWHGYGQRDATWEPESHLLQYTANTLASLSPSLEGLLASSFPHFL